LPLQASEVLPCGRVAILISLLRMQKLQKMMASQLFTDFGIDLIKRNLFLQTMGLEKQEKEDKVDEIYDESNIRIRSM